jgi:hypothetical protein
MTIVLSSIGSLSVMAYFQLPTHHVLPSDRCIDRHVTQAVQHKSATLSLSSPYRNIFATGHISPLRSVRSSVMV